MESFTSHSVHLNLNKNENEIKTNANHRHVELVGTLQGPAEEGMLPPPDCTSLEHQGSGVLLGSLALTPTWLPF